MNVIIKEGKRGYYGVGIYGPLHETNVGTLLRSAYSFKADFMYTIGGVYTPQRSDTHKAPRHIPLYHYEDFEDFMKHRPIGGKLVAVEMAKRAKKLSRFVHPCRAIYLLGSENTGLPDDVIGQCDHVVQIESVRCLNVATSGSIVMYDRQTKSIH